MPPVLHHPIRTPGDRGLQLDRLVVDSATVRDVDTAAREMLAVALEKRSVGSAERVLIHTCHRVELIAFVAGTGELADPPETMHRSSGLAAAERVMLVAGGLDSTVLAEEQVLGQVLPARVRVLLQGQMQRVWPQYRQPLRRRY